MLLIIESDMPHLLFYNEPKSTQWIKLWPMRLDYITSPRPPPHLVSLTGILTAVPNCLAYLTSLAGSLSARNCLLIFDLLAFFLAAYARVPNSPPMWFCMWISRYAPVPIPHLLWVRVLLLQQLLTCLPYPGPPGPTFRVLTSTWLYANSSRA